MAQPAGALLARRYKVIRTIAEGGMAELYLAADTVLSNRLIAIKLPSANIDDYSRFEREIQIMQSLHHPHIVSILDRIDIPAEVHQGGDTTRRRLIPGIVMELLQQSVEDLLQDAGFLPWRQAVAIARQCAVALEFFHSRNAIHRDIKPANLLISKTRQSTSTSKSDPEYFVKLADFGIAREETRPRLTATSRTIGTPDYMSPEQARAQKLYPSSDLFSLGLTLYELLCGRLPTAAPMEDYRQPFWHDSRPPCPPSINAPNSVTIPLLLDNVVLDMIQPDMSLRVGTAADVIMRIDEVLKLQDDSLASRSHAFDISDHVKHRRHTFVIPVGDEFLEGSIIRVSQGRSTFTTSLGCEVVVAYPHIEVSKPWRFFPSRSPVVDLDSVSETSRIYCHHGEQVERDAVEIIKPVSSTLLQLKSLGAQPVTITNTVRDTRFLCALRHESRLVILLS